MNKRNHFFSRFAAHSSLDYHLARWFGLNQSKYQWALDDYYESKGLVMQMFQIWITMSFSVSAEIAPSKDGCCGGKTTRFAKATLLNSRDQIVSAPLVLV
ncbi:hypothetical protein GQ457_16G011900 [Hibiscus cannabinus]